MKLYIHKWNKCFWFGSKSVQSKYAFVNFAKCAYCTKIFCFYKKDVIFGLSKTLLGLASLYVPSISRHFDLSFFQNWTAFTLHILINNLYLFILCQVGWADKEWLSTNLFWKVLEGWLKISNYLPNLVSRLKVRKVKN